MNEKIVLTKNQLEKVKAFIETALLGKSTANQGGLSHVRFFGGSQEIDTNAISDAEGMVLHVTAINRKHRILQEV